MMFSPETRLGRKETVMSSLIGSSLIMMDCDEGSYFELDGTARRIWELIEVPTTIDALCAALVVEFEVDPETCRLNTIEFLAELQALGMISVD